MKIVNALAGVAVARIDDAVAWYSKVIGGSPHGRPMEGLAEFRFDRGGWLQIFEDRSRAGKSSVTLAVSSLDEQIQALRKVGVDIGNRTKTEYVATAIVNDPDGNQIVFAESLDAKNQSAR